MKQFIPCSITDVATLRSLSNDPNFVSMELFKAEADGHKFAVDETRTLVGLTSFPEYNGEKVKITAIRKNGPNGSKAYYIEGRINAVLNWVYEYRLE